MQMSNIKSLLITAVVGYLYLNIALVMFWRPIILYNPTMDWLLEHFAGTGWFSPLLFIQDFIINTVLSFPLALFIHYLRPQSYWIHGAVAVLPGFLWTHSVWINDPGFSQIWQSVAIGWVHSLATLPLAVMVVIWLSGRRA
ncbi:hypothetical protein DRW07_14775 [Alteromonas sediminis]|uniref:Uncharacterized protein n=1 Tax=Alteromonas sediminis TaxID=2259342 RepID=A0A3N5YLK8_9ALTE|nr:hypothetical protein [Alteromonas sediminis]RPJ66061.1 hypothetical protein DRW07_14775 [Alteromonas sediminis]